MNPGLFTWLDFFGKFLRFQGQFCCQKAMRLRHGRFCSVEDIVYKLFAKRKRLVVAIKIDGFFVVGHVKVIA